MDEPTTNETKVMKALRLHPEIVKAIDDGYAGHDEYPSETAYIEAIFRLVFGLPEPPRPPRPKPLRISKEAMALRA